MTIISGEQSSNYTLDSSAEYKIIPEFKHFPVRRENTPALHKFEQDVLGPRLRGYFAYPTEPYPDKKKFLLDELNTSATKVLTICGANWPVFYIDLFGKNLAEIQAVDPNVNAFILLESFIYNEMAFRKMILNYNPSWIARGIDKKISQLPYIDNDITSKIKRWLLKNRLKALVRSQKLKATNGFIQSLSSQELSAYDFVDLSNVHEFDLIFDFDGFTKKLKPGAHIYISEINGMRPIQPALLQHLEVVKKQVIESVIVPNEKLPHQRTTFYLFRRK